MKKTTSLIQKLAACVIILIAFSSAEELSDEALYEIFGESKVSTASLPIKVKDEFCKCVPYYFCQPRGRPNNDGNFDGVGLIDIRFNADNYCSESIEVCCDDVLDAPLGFVDHPERRFGCGIRNTFGTDFTIISDDKKESEIFEFPWMIAVLSAADSSSICGGSLIHPRVVLTAAHCVKRYRTIEVKIRAGEWDTQTEKERIPHQERAVSEFIIHPSFDDKKLIYDVALIILKTPVVLGDNINTICLPEVNEDFQRAKECIATGWGKKSFGALGVYSVIMKKVVMDIVDNNKCNFNLKNTLLGNIFQLHYSFMCAGGVKGVDTCQGDGGAPLVCPTEAVRYKQVGIVSWGLGCGEENIPGVYGSIREFKLWIDYVMNNAGFGTESYTLK